MTLTIQHLKTANTAISRQLGQPLSPAEDLAMTQTRAAIQAEIDRRLNEEMDDEDLDDLIESRANRLLSQVDAAMANSNSDTQTVGYAEFINVHRAWQLWCSATAEKARRAVPTAPNGGTLTATSTMDLT